MVLCPCTEGDTCGYVQSTIQSWRGNKIFRLTKLKEYIWFKKTGLPSCRAYECLVTFKRVCIPCKGKCWVNVGNLKPELHVHF